jgi:hypothetical protein
MRQHERPLAPLEAVPLERQGADVRRRDRERVERAEEVVPVARLDQLRRSDGAAGLRLLLEDDDVPAGVGEDVRGDEPVRAGPDDDGIGDGPDV